MYAKKVDEDNIIKVDVDGQVIFGQNKPSIETGMHLAIYSKRPDVQGVIHAHLRSTSVFAVAQKPIDVSIILMIGVITTCALKPSGSRKNWMPLE